MNDAITTTPPKWFWFVSGIALLWNALGVLAFIGQMLMDPASLPPAEMAFYEATPLWATIAFAIAVFGGTLGCIGLLMRQRWAMLVLAISLFGIVVQISHSIFIGDGAEVFGPGGLVLPAITLTVGVALIWFARYATHQGWLQGSLTVD